MPFVSIFLFIFLLFMPTHTLLDSIPGENWNQPGENWNNYIDVFQIKPNREGNLEEDGHARRKRRVWYT